MEKIRWTWDILIIFDLGKYLPISSSNLVLIFFNGFLSHICLRKIGRVGCWFGSIIIPIHLHQILYFVLIKRKPPISFRKKIRKLIENIKKHEGCFTWQALYKKWSFPLRISSVNLTKSTVSRNWKLLNGTLHFL